MANVRIITDSACDLPSHEAERSGVEVVPLSIRFGDEEFTDRVGITAAEFWAKCAATATLPETAAPSPGAFAAAYQRAVDDGCDGVLVVTLSSALSATYQSALVAAESATVDVRVVDSRAVSMAQGFLAVELAALAADGADLDQLVTRADVLRERVGVVATLDTLEHLVKGGRVGGARALLGQVLSIKPLLQLRDGVVAEAGRQRTRARAMAAVVERVREAGPLERLAIIEGGCHDVEAFRALADQLSATHPTVLAQIGPVVGTHAGPGIIGLAWVEAGADARH